MGIRIVCAAIKNKNGKIILGIRHFDGFMCEQMEVCLADWKKGEIIQGFVDNKGNFLSRDEAYKIAKENKQIIREVGGDKGKLFSENLY